MQCDVCMMGCARDTELAGTDAADAFAARADTQNNHTAVTDNNNNTVDDVADDEDGDKPVDLAVPSVGAETSTDVRTLDDGALPEYAPLKLDPRFARAELSGLFELVQLTQHYHPSVRHYATALLKSEPIEHAGNPLEDFSLAAFLDRFVYRNPKSRSAAMSDPASKEVRGCDACA
jgi:hypothetical protein